MRFESKRDLWLVLVARVLPFVVLVLVAIQGNDRRGPLAGLVILVAIELLLIEPMMRSTYYVIEGETLLIRSGFMKWRAPIGEIRSVTPTRSPLSSPALSLDRLRIDYGKKSIMISPEDKQTFIEALRAINPSIVA